MKMKLLYFVIATLSAGSRPTNDTIKFMCSSCVLYDTESNTIFDYEVPGTDHVHKPINRTIAQRLQLSYLTNLISSINIQLHDTPNVSPKELILDMDEILTVDELNRYHLNMTNILITALTMIICIFNIIMTGMIYFSRKRTVQYPLLSSDKNIVQDTQDWDAQSGWN